MPVDISLLDLTKGLNALELVLLEMLQYCFSDSDKIAFHCRCQKNKV